MDTMNTVSYAGAGTYEFFGYDAKQEYPAPDGKRLVTALYRAAKQGEQPARENAGMFIPDWITADMVEDNLPQLMEYIVAYLQGQEQEYIRQKHKECSTMLGASVFTLDSLLGYMNSKGAGARLSGELISKWFADSGLEEALQQMYTERTGSADKAEKLVTFIAGKLRSLASPKTIWSEEEKNKLVPLLDAVEDGDIMKQKLLARIAAMAGATDNMLDAL